MKYFALKKTRELDPTPLPTLKFLGLSLIKRTLRTWMSKDIILPGAIIGPQVA